MELASKIATETITANSIFPNSLQAVEMRRGHLLEAKAAIYALCAKLGLCYRTLMRNPQGAFTTANGRQLTSEEAVTKLDKMAQKLGEALNRELELIEGVLNRLKGDENKLKNGKSLGIQTQDNSILENTYNQSNNSKENQNDIFYEDVPLD